MRLSPGGYPPKTCRFLVGILCDIRQVLYLTIARMCMKRKMGPLPTNAMLLGPATQHNQLSHTYWWIRETWCSFISFTCFQVRHHATCRHSQSVAQLGPNGKKYDEEQKDIQHARHFSARLVMLGDETMRRPKRGLFLVNKVRTQTADQLFEIDGAQRSSSAAGNAPDVR